MALASAEGGSVPSKCEFVPETVTLPSLRRFLGMGKEQLPSTPSFLLGRLLSALLVRSQEPVTLSTVSQERLWTTAVSPETDEHAGRAPVPDREAAELG